MQIWHQLAQKVPQGPYPPQKDHPESITHLLQGGCYVGHMGSVTVKIGHAIPRPKEKRMDQT